jgi:hypothetical protein
LEPVLKEHGFDVGLFIGEGKPLTKSVEEIALVASSAHVVVLGMSSSPELAQPEIAAGEAAKKAGVPYGFYGDVPRCWARARSGAWFEQLAPSAAFYCGVTQADSDAAREVFPNARLIGTGNPLREEMAFPRFTREEVRAKLNIAPEEKLVLAPGGKFAAGNMASWVVVMDALRLLVEENQYFMERWAASAEDTGLVFKDIPFQLILATHPGDRTPYVVDSATQKEMRLYDELISFSPVPARIVGKDVLTTSDMVPGADIIVEFGSSIGIEGAYQGVPVVSLAFEILSRRLEQASGTRTLEAVSDGLSELVVADASKLADTIKRLLTPSGYAPMRAKQQELCPKQKERGVALRKIAEAIAQVS